MRYVPLIDATGYQSLKEIIHSFNSRNIKVILSGISPELYIDFKNNNMFSILEEELVLPDVQKAIEKSIEILKPK